MAGEEIKRIRDFVYVDVPRLYSMYSQVFQGVTDQIVNERIERVFSGDVQRSPMRFSSGVTEESDTLRYSESGFPHDHMYSKLEEALEPVMWKADEEEDPQPISEHFMAHQWVKVRGTAEVEDYERFRQFLEKFNDIAGVIAYAGLSEDLELQMRLAQVDREIAEADTNNKRKSAQQKRNQMVEAAWERAKQAYKQDPKTLENLKLFAETYNPGGYEIMIAPSNGSNIRYRGVLARTWLRSDPGVLRSLYGEQSAIPWTMVGYITTIPQTFQNLAEPDVGFSSNPTNPMVGPVVKTTNRPK